MDNQINEKDINAYLVKMMPENPISQNSLSDTELVAKCSEWISKLCESGGKAWSLRVPVDFKHDPDVLFSELIKRFEASSKRVV